MLILYRLLYKKSRFLFGKLDKKGDRAIGVALLFFANMPDESSPGSCQEVQIKRKGYCTS